jgi:murein DD-endopeptidase MepM/ murein hydrolase activator NlpD
MIQDTPDRDTGVTPDDPLNSEVGDGSVDEIAGDENRLSPEERKRHLIRLNALTSVVAATLLVSSLLLVKSVWSALTSPPMQPPALADSLALDAETLNVATYKDQLGWGDNLAGALSRNLTDDAEIEAVLPILGHLTDLRRIPVGTQLTLERDELGLRDLTVRLPKTQELLRLKRTGPLLYIAEIDTVPIDTLLVRYEGVVQSNFYDSFMGAGGSAELAVKFIEVFQFVHYFSSETRRGDSYSLIAEELWQEGKRIGYDDILVATYASRDDTLTAVWQPLSNDEFGGEHFDKTGRSLRRNLLRVPFSAARVTSTFGVRRHPISGRVRFHHGVDLGARMGTPIVAAGSGVITKIQWNHPGYGNWIHIKHDRTGFETRYGHMKAFASGMRRGLRVKQGQVIGYVGMTGHATGPHLHYEVFRDGRRLNPMRVKGSPVKQLKGKDLTHFLEDRYHPWSVRLRSRGILPNRHYQGPLPSELDALYSNSSSEDSTAVSEVSEGDEIKHAESGRG